MGKFTFALLVLLAGCGHKRPKMLSIVGFERYVKEFEDISTSVGNPTTIDDLYVHFGTPDQFSDSSRVAFCYTDGDSTPEIVIDRDFWESTYENRRLALFMHEAGHCVLHQQHRTDVKSLMNPYLPNDYGNYYDYYNQELFLFQRPGYYTLAP